MKIIETLKKDWFWLVLCAIYLGVFAFFYPNLPAKIPSQIGFDGTINSYMEKESFIFMALLPIFIYILMVLAPYWDPRGKNYQKFEKYYSIIRGSLLVLFMGINSIMVAIAFGYDMDVSKTIAVLFGIVFAIMGNYMPTVKQNFLLGIKTPWTLSSERNWYKTHRFAGPLYTVGGIILAISGIMSLTTIGFAIFFIFIFAPIIYSFVLFKKGI